MGLNSDAWNEAVRSFCEAPGRWDWLCEWARSARVLPIYCDWTHAFGLTADGQVFAWECEPWPGAASPIPDGVVTDVRILNLALHEGAKLYPWIAALLPRRPADAQSCSGCDGQGQVPYPMICYCGGAGWVPAGDTWVNRNHHG